jgi:hypothetical protein
MQNANSKMQIIESAKANSSFSHDMPVNHILDKTFPNNFGYKHFAFCILLFAF